MPDYAKMYAILCAAASEALDALPKTAENAEGRRLLQAALIGAPTRHACRVGRGGAAGYSGAKPPPPPDGGGGAALAATEGEKH